MGYELRVYRFQYCEYAIRGGPRNMNIFESDRHRSQHTIHGQMTFIRILDVGPSSLRSKRLPCERSYDDDKHGSRKSNAQSDVPEVYGTLFLLNDWYEQFREKSVRRDPEHRVRK